MDCRTFRKKHLAFVDDTLPGIDLVAMQRHLAECRECAKHDAHVRRALLLVRNITSIEPSKDFTARLNARLAIERAAMMRPPAHPRGPGVRTFMAVAAGLVAAGYLAAVSLDWMDPPGEIALAPVVATQPELSTPLASPPFADPALVASVSAGVPLWPVMFFADQAPVHFVTEQFTQTSAR
jgi:hypothetical protein